MQINRKLHLVIPVSGEDGQIRAYVHASAISSELFDRYFLVISKTFAAIHGEGLGVLAGPRVADKMLRHVAESMGQWEEVRAGLVAEIERLATVLVVGEAGWEPVPLHDVKKRALLEAEDLAEIEAALTFFIVGSAMYVREIRASNLEAAASFWGAQISSLPCTAFAASLTTSTAAAPSGGTAPA